MRRPRGKRPNDCLCKRGDDWERYCVICVARRIHQRNHNLLVAERKEQRRILRLEKLAKKQREKQERKEARRQAKRQAHEAVKVSRAAIAQARQRFIERHSKISFTEHKVERGRGAIGVDRLGNIVTPDATPKEQIVPQPKEDFSHYLKKTTTQRYECPECFNTEAPITGGRRPMIHYARCRACGVTLKKWRFIKQ